jgi:hypothetical protein
MAYKAFQDFYKELSIKHLLLNEYQDVLVSPPFATEKCKDYNKIAVFDKKVYYIDTDLPAATSKTNAIANVNDSLWMVPYGIWDEYNVVLELKDFKPEYHHLDKKGKGQFYSIASNGNSACSFPLGYHGTQFLIYIDSNGVHTKDFVTEHTKCHMGTVYCNGKYWSMPRGDTANYQSLVSYDGQELKEYFVPALSNITRKFTDIVTVGNTLYSMPFGETKGLNSIIEFNTKSGEFFLHDIGVPDFAKKYNAQVLVDDVIIGLPYGDEHHTDSDYGVIFNTITKHSQSFKINEKFGGKYRYRSGIAFEGSAIFLPSGTPSCPIYKVDQDGQITSKHYPNLLFGRPALFKNKLFTIVYNLNSNRSFIVNINNNLDMKEVTDL